jgi:hypothetical protein
LRASSASPHPGNTGNGVEFLNLAARRAEPVIEEQRARMRPQSAQRDNPRSLRVASHSRLARDRGLIHLALSLLAETATLAFLAK